MFKKIKENEKVQLIKELWQNKKTHDIIMLVFWLLFMFIVILFVRSTTTSSSSSISQPNTSTFDSINSYEFTLKTNNLETNGFVYNDKEVFYLNNKRYYYNGNTYQIDDAANIILNFDLKELKLTSKFLNNLTSGITANNMDNYKQYIVPLDRFINLYEIDTDVDLSKAASYNVLINVYLSDNEINKVVLDLSNYYTLKNGQQTNYLVTINFYNINNVSNFSKSYEKMLEVH